MTENILRWDYGSESAKSIVDYINAAGDRGRIKRLTFMPDGTAIFASWGRENAFVRQLSEENPGVTLTHLWMNEEKGVCGYFHWQDGRIIADDTPTNETELSDFTRLIREEIERAEEQEPEDFPQNGLDMR